jgi:hypothetical protein
MYVDAFCCLDISVSRKGYVTFFGTKGLLIFTTPESTSFDSFLNIFSYFIYLVCEMLIVFFLPKLVRESKVWLLKS